MKSNGFLLQTPITPATEGKTKTMTLLGQPESKRPLLLPVLRLLLVTMILANVARAMYIGFLPLYLNVSYVCHLAISYFLIGIGSSLMSPAYQSLVSKVFPQKLRGACFGLVHSGLGLFSLPVLAIGVRLYENISPTTPFWMTTAASVLAIIPVIFKFKLTDKDRQHIEEAEAKILQQERFVHPERSEGSDLD